VNVVPTWSSLWQKNNPDITGKIGHNAQEKYNQFGFYSKKVAIILDSIPKRLYF
jgi:hypothetical protein